MGFQDRHYMAGDSDGGGFRGAWRRITDGDSFFSWSLPLFTAFRIRVRVHLIFVLMVVVQLIQSLIERDSIGVMYAAWGMAALFILVLLHEFGHCFACRWAGGEADQILMWPLGGLAFCAPPNNWRANLITTAGGPGVNLLLMPILAAVLLGMGVGWRGILFNPLDPKGAIVATGMASHAQVLVFWLHYMNLVLFLFNVLLPMYPLDSGKLVQEILWWRIGYERSMRISVNLGLFVAIFVGLFGLLGGNGYLFSVAFFAGVTCVQQRRALDFLAAEGAGSVPGGYDFSRGYSSLPSERTAPDPSSRKYKRALRQQQEEQHQQAEVDRILSKIAMSGMNSLTRAERKTLEQATRKQRDQAG